MAEKLNIVKLGLALGITSAIYALFLGLVAWLFDWGTGIVTTMSSLYIGYAPTLIGTVIGTLWLLIDGFIAGILIGFFYNVFIKW